jgi:hypothetical protein
MLMLEFCGKFALKVAELKFRLNFCGNYRLHFLNVFKKQFNDIEMGVLLKVHEMLVQDSFARNNTFHKQT